MKKRLLIATDAFPPRWDGISRFLHETLPDLVDTFEITVVAPEPVGITRPYEPIQGVTVIRVPTFKVKFGDYHPARFAWSKISSQVKEADIVWTHALMPIGVCAIFAAKKQKKPLIATVHSIEKLLVKFSLSESNLLRFPANYIVDRLVRYFYNKCSIISVPSKEVLELLTWQGVTTQKIVVPLGVDTDRFKPPVDKRVAKKQIGIDPKKKVIGYCGRIAREKDLVTLYRAFVRLEKKNDVVLLVVGDGLASIRDMFVRKESVRSVGAVDDVVPYLQAMDIHVLPSLTETSSLSTMEAMACGLGVITTPVGMMKDYIEDGKNGLFFPKRNALTLVQKIQMLLDNSRLLTELGQEARKTIVRRFTLEQTTEKLEKVLTVIV